MGASITHCMVHLQAIASHLPDTPMMVYGTVRWAHFNVKLHFSCFMTILSHIGFITGPTCAFCTVGSYASHSVCLDVCLSITENLVIFCPNHTSYLMGIGTLNSGLLRFDACHRCESQRGLIANVKLHF